RRAIGIVVAVFRGLGGQRQLEGILRPVKVLDLIVKLPALLKLDVGDVHIVLNPLIQKAHGRRNIAAVGTLRRVSEVIGQVPGAGDVDVIGVRVQPGDQADQRQNGVVVAAVEELIAAHPQQARRRLAEAQHRRQQELIVKPHASGNQALLALVVLLRRRVNRLLQEGHHYQQQDQHQRQQHLAPPDTVLGIDFSCCRHMLDLPAVKDQNSQNEQNRRVDEGISNALHHKGVGVGDLNLGMDDRVLNVEVAEVRQQVVHQRAYAARNRVAAGGQRVGDAAQVADQEDAKREEEVDYRRGERREEDRQRRQQQHLEEGQHNALEHIRRDMMAGRLEPEHRQKYDAHGRNVDEDRGEPAQELAQDELIALHRLGKHGVDRAPLDLDGDQVDAGDNGNE